MKRAFWLIGCLAVLLTLPAAAQQNFDNVELTVEPVAGTIYMIVGPGGNIGVTVGEDGILIIDDLFAPLAEKIRAKLQEVGGGKLRFILNTHWHGDHTGANPEFGKEANIVAHTNVRKRLSETWQSGTRTVEPIAKEGWPIITFDQSVSVHFNGEEIKAIHVPHSHTDGDSVIFFTKSNVVHMGDEFFSGMFPFVDLSSGGSVSGMIHGVAQVLEKIPADAKVIPGHGPLSSVNDLRLYHAMLSETSAIVRRKMAEGESLEDIKKEGLPGWESWGTGFISTDRWIETIYNDASRPR